jgi:hypothetical protein
MLDHELTHTLWAPLPWYEGKQAAIHTYIHPWKKPVLVAGDTPASDGPMFFRAPDVERGAMRLFVSRKPDYHDRIHAMQKHHALATVRPWPPGHGRPQLDHRHARRDRLNLSFAHDHHHHTSTASPTCWPPGPGCWPTAPPAATCSTSA